MPSDIRSILSLEVPIIVLLGERSMKISDVVSLIPGSIVELPKKVDEELSLLVNNRSVGSGVAVKVGENFGLKVTYMGNLVERIAALGDKPAEAGKSEDEVAALAEAMLAGQV
jgi:flagellar motor switch protein FliN/FliY